MAYRGAFPPPKKSLGIFGGLKDVLAEREQRKLAEDDRQVRLEDRLAASTRQGLMDVRDEEMRTLEKALGEQRLADMKKPPLVKPNRTYDAKRGKVIDLDAGKATDLGLAPETEPPKARRTQFVKDHRGMMVLADLDSGLGPDGQQIKAWQEPEKPVKSGVDALPLTQQNQLKLQQSAVMNLQGAIKRLDDAVAANGLELGPGKGRAAMDALMKEAQVQYKEAANLGVLNGPDLTLIEQALGNATNPMQLLRGGAGGVRASLKAAREALRGRARTMETVYGVKMPDGFFDDEEAANVPAHGARDATAPPSARTPTGPMPTLDPDSWLGHKRATKPPGL